MPWPTDHRGPGPGTVPELTAFRFDPVSVLGAFPAPTVDALGAVLLIDERGIELRTAQPGRGFLMGWTEVERVALGRPATAADGAGSATSFEVDGGGRRVRVSIPTDPRSALQLEALDRQLARWSRAAPMALPPPGPMAPVSTGSDHRRGRPRRRLAVLVAGLVLVLAGAGLAVDLARAPAPADVASRPSVAPDQALAHRVLLTYRDLPRGWSEETDPSAASDAPSVRSGQASIASGFARCLGIPDQQAVALLGGQAADQTARSASPIFVAPTSAGRPGYGVELQTAAAVVRSAGAEERDLAELSSPQYPQCVADAVAAETQLGVNGSSGVDDRAGPATATVIHLTPVGGERLSGVLVSFSVTDGTTTEVPVQVETLTIGSRRVEGDLQAFAIGGPLPTDVLTSSAAIFEGRLADGGGGLQV